MEILLLKIALLPIYIPVRIIAAIGEFVFHNEPARTLDIRAQRRLRPRSRSDFIDCGSVYEENRDLRYKKRNLERELEEEKRKNKKRSR